MPQTSILMFVCNDVQLAIERLGSTKEYVDEQIVIDCSSDENKRKLAAYAQTNSKIKMHSTVALGLPEPYIDYAINKCKEGNWILLIAPDEAPSKDFLGFLKNLNLTDENQVFYITRYETPDKRFSIFQPRLFKKGHVKWLGFVHEYPKISGKKVRLDGKYYLLHLKDDGLRRDYNKLLVFSPEMRVVQILRGLYLTLKTNPARLPSALGHEIELTRRTEKEKRIGRKIAKIGITDFLGLGQDEVVAELYLKYKDKKQGTDLLIELITQRYDSG